ncbi:hypothetical protein ALSL_0224 [Aerosticca soli]|uniref:Uncharacterized protein n=1 Tax=Aerosticca soli TaxID=2010829 RepID=A0A2Z6E1M3_9GAMM|nr:hypothetical protein ALSL_0224 [Aerosticca soli]
MHGPHRRMGRAIPRHSPGAFEEATFPMTVAAQAAPRLPHPGQRANQAPAYAQRSIEMKRPG